MTQMSDVIESMGEDSEIDLSALSDSNVEIIEVSSDMPEETVVALEGFCDLLDEVKDVSDRSVNVRVANMQLNVLRMSEGLESFGIDRDFKVKSSEDIGFVVDMIRGRIENQRGFEDFGLEADEKKSLWEKFKAWLDSMLDKIRNLGRLFMKKLADMLNYIKNKIRGEPAEDKGVDMLHKRGPWPVNMLIIRSPDEVLTREFLDISNASHKLMLQFFQHIKFVNTTAQDALKSASFSDDAATARSKENFDSAEEKILEKVNEVKNIVEKAGIYNKNKHLGAIVSIKENGFADIRWHVKDDQTRLPPGKTWKSDVYLKFILNTKRNCTVVAESVEGVSKEHTRVFEYHLEAISGINQASKKITGAVLGSALSSGSSAAVHSLINLCKVAIRTLDSYSMMVRQLNEVLARTALNMSIDVDNLIRDWNHEQAESKRISNESMQDEPEFLAGVTAASGFVNTDRAMRVMDYLSSR